jgi:mannan endo-1,4-beta-mannosidase
VRSAYRSRRGRNPPAAGRMSWPCFSFVSATAAICALGAAITANSGALAAQAGPFVRVQGTHFTLEGHPFNVAGVNNHYLTFGSRSEVDRVLDDAVAMRANVVRTFIQPVIGSLDGKYMPTIWDWRNQASSSDLGVHGVYMMYWNDRAQKMAINDGPDGLQRLDYLVAEASKRRLRLIVAFVDFWGYTGGIQQMRAWYGSEDKNTFFFSDPRPREDYKQFVAHVLTRRNAITGTVYRDDPTIFAWELANEPVIKPAALRDSWIAEMTAFVKSIDHHHLVSSGRANSEPLSTDFDAPGPDFLTWHGYPAYVGVPADQFDRVISKYCALGRSLGKPILLEEFGNARTDGNQAALYASWLDTIDMDPDCAGWAVWRLVSRQDDDRYPKDDFDKFDIHNDGSETWRTLQRAAERSTSTGTALDARQDPRGNGPSFTPAHSR